METYRSFSPFTIRPGTVCDVEVTYIVEESVIWDSSIIYSDTFTGLVVEQSVKSDVDLSDANISITSEGDNYTVTIQPLNLGEITLNIYRYEKSIQEITAVSAFTEDDTTYYKDYITSNGKIIPATIIDFGEIEEAYRIEVVKVTPRITNNGIDYINGDLIQINNCGLLTYLNLRTNILRKGMQKVLVPTDFDGQYISIQNTQKLIEFENQEWQDGFAESRGILVYGPYLLVLCDSGLCTFDIYGTFQNYLIYDSFVNGYDLSYYPDDTIGVTNGTLIYKYKLRHDFGFIDIDNKRIYFRETDPRFSIIGL